MNESYVYVYIDPRNYEEFYYGKGIGSRKDDHKSDTSDSEKVRRIKEIKDEGLDPIIRVIARDLSDEQALLVEKTLIWKFGNQTSNIASGHFSSNFRPDKTMHMELSGFDYRCGVCYFNCGEDEQHNWDDFVEFGFISGGQGKSFKDAMLGFNLGDIVCVYIPAPISGYVGVGRIASKAKRVREFIKHGTLEYKILMDRRPELWANCDNDELSEYVCSVNWLKTVSRNNAIRSNDIKLFRNQNVRCSLDGQLQTVLFLEEKFNIAIRDAAS